MTPEQLAAAIKRGDVVRCIKMLCGATEAERRCARKAVVILDKTFWSHTANADGKADWPRASDSDWSECLAALTISHLGTATLSELRRVRIFPGRYPDAVFQILTARRPPWLSDWVAHLLDSARAEDWFNAGSRWKLIRKFIRSGQCDRPDTDAYIVGLMAYDEWGETKHDTGMLRAMLLEDRALLEYEVWRLFEVEGNAVGSMAKSRLDWSGVLVEFSSEGLLDRQRLLDCSLAALQRDFSDYHAAWYSRFFEALKPTISERKQREQALRDLLASRASTTVAFALRSLKALSAAKQLDHGPFLTCVIPAVAARAKTSALLVIRLIRDAVNADPGLAGVGCRAAAEALYHTEPDVQSSAVDLLELWRENIDGFCTGRIHDALPGVTASQRARLESLQPKPVPEAQQPAARYAGDLRELLERTASIGARWRSLTGIDQAVAACDGRWTAVHSLDLTNTMYPRLDPDRTIAPISDLEELFDLLSTAMEVTSSVEDYERIIDGVSRLCAEGPPDFARRTAPLIRRSTSLVGTWAPRHRHRAWFLRNGGPAGVALLIREWLVPEAASIAPGDPPIEREEEVALRAAVRQPRPLLSLPTHAGGWIDPRVAVARFRQRLAETERALTGEVPKQGLFARIRSGARDLLGGARTCYTRPDFSDAVRAILRFAPDGRTEALADATDLPGEIGAAVRYALGSDGETIGPTGALWVAACRSRNPHSDDPLVEQAHPRLGPDSGLAARACLLDEPVKPARLASPLYVLIQPPIPPKSRPEYPTVCRHGWQTDPRGYLCNTVQAETAIWPSGRHSLVWRGTQTITDNLDWWEARWDDIAFVELLLDPDLVMDHMARLLLGAALGAFEAGQSGMATDALIAGIADGRIDGAVLAEALALPLRIKHVKPQRWAKTLAEAARASELHALVVLNALVDVLCELLRRKPVEYVGLLELLHELCVESGAEIDSEDAREALASITGSSKSAKLARSLLALKPAPAEEQYLRAAAIRALEGRIARAERWQRWAEAGNTPSA